MNWIELSVKTDAEGAEAAAALLNEFVSGGAAIEETLLPEPGESFDPARAFTVRVFFPAHDRALVERAETSLWHLTQLRAMSTPRTRELAEEDWAEAWKKYYTILRIGASLVIKPSWLEYAPRETDRVIELDPGMAFGTGLHPTTRLCMIALEKYAASHPERTLSEPKRKSKDDPSQGFSALDVGTGSGILSITAAKLGAREILALDTDPIAVETAARNVAINHAESVVRVKQGSLDATGQRDLFDLICINILAEVICDLAPALGAAVRPGGIVIASGILDYKADGVADALNAVGIEIVEKMQEEDWIALIGTRRTN